MKRERQPTPVFLPGEPHGKKQLVGCSPWGHKESDKTERVNNNISGETGREIYMPQEGSHIPPELIEQRF